MPWYDDLVTVKPEIPDDHLIVPRRPRWATDVDEDPVRAHLPCERLLPAVVVLDRGQRGRVPVQRDRREGRALARVPPNELARQVLGLRRAPAVPDREQAAAGEERAGEAPAPALDPLRLGDEGREPAHGRGEVLGARPAEGVRSVAVPVSVADELERAARRAARQRLVHPQRLVGDEAPAVPRPRPLDAGPAHPLA